LPAARSFHPANCARQPNDCLWKAMHCASGPIRWSRKAIHTVWGAMNCPRKAIHWCRRAMNWPRRAIHWCRNAINCPQTAIFATSAASRSPLWHHVACLSRSDRDTTLRSSRLAAVRWPGASAPRASRVHVSVWPAREGRDRLSEERWPDPGHLDHSHGLTNLMVQVRLASVLSPAQVCHDRR